MLFVGIEPVYAGDYPWNGLSVPSRARGSELLNVLNLFALLFHNEMNIK
jgi:hypothetical protein